jgi:hypothetical protein
LSWCVHHIKLTCSGWWIARTRNTKLVILAVVSLPCRHSENMKSSAGITKPCANVQWLHNLSNSKRWGFSLMLRQSFPDLKTGWLCAVYERILRPISTKNS